MLLTLALTACLDPVEPPTGDAPPTPTPAADPTGAIATTPDREAARRIPPRPGPPPKGELVVADCFQQMDLLEGMTLGTRGQGAGGGGGFGGLGISGIGGGGVGNGSGLGGLGSGNSPGLGARNKDGRGTAPASKPAAARPSAAPMGGDAVASAPAAAPPAARPAAAEEAKKAAGEAAARSQLREEVDAPADDAARERQRPDETRGPVWDWGATVWLSNDDSMSLASAQRVLYALKRHVPLKTSEIRPHELLNYFSFDTAAPQPDRVFSVLGAAEQQGDTLTVSLAVKGATPEREPLDLTLLVDRSCSMTAEGRMDYTKRGLSLLTDQLQDGDRVDLVLLDSGVCTPIQNYVVGRDAPGLLKETIARLAPTSGTNLDAGLQAAYGLQTSRDAADVHGRNRRVLLITDALLNEGRVQESLVAQVGTNLEEHDIRLSAVGVGREFNDKMLDQLTENGKGAYVYLGSEAVVDRVFGPGFDALVRTVAHDVHFGLDLPDSLAMERFYGEEASTNKEDVKPIHYFAGTTQLFLQDLHVRPGGVVRNDPITLRVEYRDATTGEPQVQELRTTVGALMDGDPHNLRKGKALMAFSDLVIAESMGAEPCGGPLQTYRERIAGVPEDAEIAFVNGLVGDLCQVPMTTVISRGVQLKLKLDSDQPIAGVDLRCGPSSLHQPVGGSDQVARFQGVQPGRCTVELAGNVPMTAEIEVPETGADLRCMVRGGRVSCT